MVETGSFRAYDKLLVVTCSAQLQRSRLMQRDELSEDEAEKWIASQMPLTDKEAVADHIIRNDTDLDNLRLQVHRFWEWVQSLQ